MSNRAQRRASVADFKRRVSGGHLLTYLIDGDDEASLDRHTVLRDAAAFWQANRASRKPCCIACKLSLASDEAVGAFLFATSPGSPGIASVTVQHMLASAARPDRTSWARVLSKWLPSGRFEDA